MLLPVLVFLLGCTTERVVTPVVKCAKVVDVEYVKRTLYAIPSSIEVYLVLSDGSRQKNNAGFADGDSYAMAYPTAFRQKQVGTEICRTDFVNK